MKGAVIAAVLVASAAQAQSRDYCPERPGLNTAPCIIDRGRVSVETSLVDWTSDRADGERTDTVLVADSLARLGLSDGVEARVAWTPFGYVRERADNGVGRARRVGDVTLGLKANLRNPDGSGASASLLPFITLPVGREPVGAGDWGAGLLVPVNLDLSDEIAFQATPEIDATVDEDGQGRHLAYGTAVGLQWSPSNMLTVAGEVQFTRDRDPVEHSTEALGSLSLGWALNDDAQLDAQLVAGLNRDSPDLRLLAGTAFRF